MDSKIIEAGVRVFLDLAPKRAEIMAQKRLSKLDCLLLYLLRGYPVTGATMINKFKIFSYRDAIYFLRKRGYEIKEMDFYSDKGIKHRMWWIADYPYEYIKSREEKAF